MTSTLPPPLLLPLLDAVLRGMAIALALLIALLLLRERRLLQAPVGAAAVLLCLGLAVQAMGSMPWVEQQGICTLQAPLIAVAVGNAVLFWLFCGALLDDNFRWRPWHAGLWFIAALIGALQCPAVVGLAHGHGLRETLRVLLRLVPLASVLGVLWLVLRHWQADLVPARRRLRVLLLSAGGVYALTQLAARLSTPQGLLSPGLALLDITLLLVVLAGWALAALQVRTLGLFGPLPGSAPAPLHRQPEPPHALDASLLQVALPQSAVTHEIAEPAVNPVVDEALAAALHQAMVVDRAYRSELTLASLAGQLAVPEYRLRRHIHEVLGFRNFNTYVNSHRLADAQRWLADPAQQGTPVLTLALDAGFGSIGPFNRAFKAETGLTPTEFRAQALMQKLAENRNS